MQRVSCEGAPRDLGLDQGRACRDAIRADARAVGWERGRWSGWRRTPRRSGALARDLARHFPHLDERTSGLAAGAGLPRDALLALLEEELADWPVLAAGVVREGDGARLAVRLRLPLPPTGLVVRSARPDGGHAVLSLTRPAFAATLAGVNEHGLAGAVEDLDPPASQGARHERFRVPGALLLDQCLERLDSVEKALEWCAGRPGGGSARLVFADASGAVGGIELDGDGRASCAVREAASLAGDRDALVLLDPAARALEYRSAGAAEKHALASGAAPVPPGGSASG